MPFFDNLKSFVLENLAKSLNQAQHKFMDKDSRDIIDDQGQVLASNQADETRVHGLQNQYQRLIDLARVDAALERLENDAFGICIGCGVEMDLSLLAEDPALAKCDFCSSADKLSKRI
jgi:DnaK suppressor protein